MHKSYRGSEWFAFGSAVKRRFLISLNIIFMQTKEQKEIIIKELTEKLKNSKAVVFSDYKGLNVKDMTILRKDLREEGVDLQVLKKTLMNRALKDAGIEMDAKKLEGQVAIAVSSRDEVAAAKIIAKLAKVNENLKIVGGILGTKELSVDEVNALAKLPSKEELLSKLVGTLNAPVSGFVNVLAGNMRGFVTALQAIADKK
ncbi:MAG: 50S ribosomal protein L10 [Candidatus Moranbacteria bacterium CG23_combo_of_CG06-09_8_20_14_all_39_10]|nr:MAG: 50S ribosomal protein L10 [Candidatus Moranbacteria bacterium CG23_combo_of_CG06-09_8_20_14_all_39_10]